MSKAVDAHPGTGLVSRDWVGVEKDVLNTRSWCDDVLVESLHYVDD